MQFKTQTAIIFCIGPGRENYCEVLQKHLASIWPEHPDIYFSLQRGMVSKCESAITTNKDCFTEALKESLDYLKKRGYNSIFFMLEDHAPLRPVNNDWFCKIENIISLSKADCITLPLYDWPWNKTSNRYDEDGRIIGWEEIRTITISEERLAVVPINYFRYNQCQPTIWNTAYFIEVLNDAITFDRKTPWDFEEFIAICQRQHYVSEYKWPSFGTDGYLKRGRIIWPAIRMMNCRECESLRDALLREMFDLKYCPAELLQFWGEIIYQSKRLRGRALHLLR